MAARIRRERDGGSSGCLLRGGYHIATFEPDLTGDSFDVTSHLQTMLDSGATHFGFRLRAVGTGPSFTLLNYNTTNAGAPALTGTFSSSSTSGSTVPEPSSFSLAGLGLCCLGFRRRKRA